MSNAKTDIKRTPSVPDERNAPGDVAAVGCIGCGYPLLMVRGKPESWAPIGEAKFLDCEICRLRAEVRDRAEVIAENRVLMARVAELRMGQAKTQDERAAEITVPIATYNGLQRALEEANEMVCRFHMPYGWLDFQTRWGLRSAAEVNAQSSCTCGVAEGDGNAAPVLDVRCPKHGTSMPAQDAGKPTGGARVCRACGKPNAYWLYVDGGPVPCCEGSPACEAKLRPANPTVDAVGWAPAKLTCATGYELMVTKVVDHRAYLTMFTGWKGGANGKQVGTQLLREEAIWLRDAIDTALGEQMADVLPQHLQEELIGLRAMLRKLGHDDLIDEVRDEIVARKK